jgi:hypothetical protein
MAGRFGSGPRRNPARAKARVEGCLITLDIRRLLPDGEVAHTHGIVRIGVHSVAYRVLDGKDPAVEVAYSVFHGAETVARRQRIAFLPSWEPFEGRGWWLECPECRRRVSTVYMPNARAVFACRRCSGLTYTSTQTHDHRVNRLRRNPERVAAVLTGTVQTSETEYLLAIRAACGGRYS